MVMSQWELNPGLTHQRQASYLCARHRASPYMGQWHVERFIGAGEFYRAPVKLPWPSVSENPGSRVLHMFIAWYKLVLYTSPRLNSTVSQVTSRSNCASFGSAQTLRQCFTQAVGFTGDWQQPSHIPAGGLRQELFQ